MRVEENKNVFPDCLNKHCGKILNIHILMVSHAAL